ncbi:MAG: hypothetical protein Q4F11_09120 [Eubacteriales bacterium]|nr:hypothetical protein [Eubacteriales bacterium]
MKNNKAAKDSKYVILAVIFMVTAVVTFISMNFEAAQLYTTTMKAATLPVVDMVTASGTHYNQLHGYTAPIDGAMLNESITPLPSDKKLSIAINTYGSHISRISYKVRNIEDSSLIENTEVKDFSQSGSTVEAQLNIKNLIDDNVLYLLEINVSTDNTSDISYYTRIIGGTDINLDDKIKFACEFNSYTFDAANLKNVLKYIETSPAGDNTNYGKVNINCTQAQIGWGDLKPMVESSIVTTVKDISNDVVILYLEYSMGAENAYDSYDTYRVGEYYRLRQTSTDMYLLNFEREAEQVFDGKNDLTASSKINLGIHSSAEVNMMADKSGVNTVFVNEGSLWEFNSDTRTFTNIFTFATDESDNVREKYNRHNFKIMNVTDSGDCSFLVYGYMNRGEHEGQVGVSLCYYSSRDNEVVEKLFLPVAVPYEILENNVGDVAYLGENNNFYILMDNTLYSIDLISKEVMVEVDGLVDGTYAASEKGSAIAYSINGKLDDTDEIRVLNIENNTDHYIKAKKGEKIRALGFIESDFIYGLANETDILKETSGITTFAMYQVNIMDSDYNVIKEYSPQGAYVSDAIVENMRITLSRIVKNEDGTYKSTSIDQLINRDENNADEGLLSEIGTTSARQQELYIVLMKAIDGIDNVTLRESKEVVFYNEATPDIDYDFTGQYRYYVYGYGRFRGSYISLSAAVNKAYDSFGTVYDYKGRLIWNRYKRAEAGINGLSWGSGEGSLVAAVSSAAAYAGSHADVVSLMNAGESAHSALNSAVNGKAVVVKGVSLEKMLYFISAGQPVIAQKDTGEYVVITGYDSTNITYADAVTGQVTVQKLTDASKAFAMLGNVFISYYR